MATATKKSGKKKAAKNVKNVFDAASIGPRDWNDSEVYIEQPSLMAKTWHDDYSDGALPGIQHVLGLEEIELPFEEVGFDPTDDSKLQIGCQSFSMSHWERAWKKIASSNGADLTSEQVERYRTILRALEEVRAKVGPKLGGVWARIQAAMQAEQKNINDAMEEASRLLWAIGDKNRAATEKASKAKKPSLTVKASKRKSA